MLTKEEAIIIARICEKWPGGMGCVLVPSNTKRGWKNAGWGWRGRRYGNFNYADLKEMPQDAIYCPVTALGIERSAQNFTGHMAAYKEIRAAVAKMLCISEQEAQKEYNRLLKTSPQELAQIFFKYSEW